MFTASRAGAGAFCCIKAESAVFSFSLMSINLKHLLCSDNSLHVCNIATIGENNTIMIIRSKNFNFIFIIDTQSNKSSISFKSFIFKDFFVPLFIPLDSVAHLLHVSYLTRVFHQLKVAVHSIGASI